MIFSPCFFVNKPDFLICYLVGKIILVFSHDIIIVEECYRGVAQLSLKATVDWFTNFCLVLQ